MIGCLSKVAVFLCMAGSVFCSQIISGSASIAISGPVTAEQSQQGKVAVRQNFKKNVLTWLTEQQGITVDTANALDNFAVDQLVDSCMRFAKDETAFQGKMVTFNLLITYDSAQIALQNHNNAVDAAAADSWKKFQSALSSNAFETCIVEGFKVIASANAHFGPPLIIPESDGKPLIQLARSAIQDVLNRLKVSSSDMIIEGKPGHTVEKPTYLTVMMDSTPVQGIWLTCKLQDNRSLFSKTTDQSGKIDFSDFRIPFVSNGTLLYVNIDPGKIIGSSSYISLKNFGIKLKNSLEQTFIIKIDRPVYKLDFKALSAGQAILPPDFTSDAYVKKFLKDSCYMQEVASGGAEDLDITVHAQVTDYNYDETEETGVKTTINVSIKGLTYNPPINSENTIVFEKKYERNIKVPYGLYFWEANTKIREVIRNVISQL